MRTVVAIPAYKPKMTDTEKYVLQQCVRVLGKQREIVLFVPESLDCQAYLAVAPEARIERFDDAFFDSVASYSNLLLMPDFYCRFSEYDYMLLFQLDGWVFRDELDLWCAKGYEYIGGPFYQDDGRDKIPVVGNGGVSLRRIEAMIRVLSAPEKRMFPAKMLLRFSRNYWAQKRYLRSLIPLLRLAGVLPNSRGRYLDSVRNGALNLEDVVFYFLSREFTPDGLLMPSLKEAALFSIDGYPSRFFSALPCFCHAWMKNEPEFWKRYINSGDDNIL